MHLLRHYFKGINFTAILVVFGFLLQGCVKEEKHPVPVVPVDFRINTEFQYIELNSPGGAVNVFGGFGGIVIYRLSIDQFTAFDRACTHHPYDENARLIVEDPPLAKCPVCESLYLLLDGTVVSGPAKYPLKQYQTQYLEPYLYVTNY